MPTFSQRPLTWLFAIAYACVMAASLADPPRSEWAGAFLVVGIYIVGASAALSQRHRLARAAVFDAGVAAATLAVFCWDGLNDASIALILAMAVTPFIAALVTRRLVGLGATGKKTRQPAAWQISIIEVLGWMIVVAIASTALRFADLGSLIDSYEGSLWVHGGVVGVLAGLFLAPERRCDRVATVLATVITLCAIYALPRVIDDWYADEGYLAPMYALVGLWILVLRLDASAVASRGEGSVATEAELKSLHPLQD
jgi:hypothetical protein